MTTKLTIAKNAKFTQIVAYGGRRCPKCNDWIDADDDCCQTCGYPWSD